MSGDYGLLGTLVVLLLVGAILYAVDRRFGVAFYRWWHNLTSANPLSEGEETGFLYRRNARARFSAATAVALLGNGVLWWFGHHGVFGVMFSTILTVVGLMAGFYLGPLLDRLWTRKDPLLDVIDKFESGERHLNEEVKSFAAKMRGRFFRTTAPAPEKPALRVVPSESAPPIPNALPKKPENPSETIRRFTERRS